MGTVIDPVPVAAFAVNFSPIPRTAPPPLGRLICGAENGDSGVERPASCVVEEGASGTNPAF